MSTRAQVRFATREDGVSFSEHPEKIHAQFYKHSDGYPEGLGLDIAMSIMNTEPINGWEIEPLTHKHGDLEYIYYIWQKPNDGTWVSIFKVNINGSYCKECGHYLQPQLAIDNRHECIFVGEPQKLIEKYKQNTNDDG